MADYQVCVITMLTGAPPAPVPVAAVAWGNAGVDVLAPEAPAIETAIRAYLATVEASSIHGALVAYGAASHPYAVEKPRTITSPSAMLAAQSALEARSFGRGPTPPLR